MKIVGLITEYNPFHNGHRYHIEEAKKVTGADAAVVIMSGDYVQRGIPAIMPKRLRAKMALKCGASAVFELPVCYATGSAELFAYGAVSFLNSLNIVDCLCFGSECDDLNSLIRIAHILSEEPPAYRQALQASLKRGNSFPAARQEALFSYTGLQKEASLLNDPNNILGIEYLKALIKTKSSICPYTIKRQDSHYHDTALTDGYSSASAIRSLLAYSSASIHTSHYGETFDNTAFSNILGQLENQVPSCCLELLKDYHRVLYPVYQNDFSLILKYKLLNKNSMEFLRYMDVSEELSNRICANLNNFFNYKQFCELLKTREVTQTRINRALLHIMLGIKKENVKGTAVLGGHLYARLLGFRRDKEKLLSLISEHSKLPLLIRSADAETLSETAKKMLTQDILASNLYTSVITDKYKTAFANEYNQPVIKI
ncbi:nucleotidyltransferase [Mediterraneibacter sp. ICN-202921]|uniref:nucleotidyltransferase n=1 Tax=Mediterraneibacter sp. ICN-202921 TaxID=3134657 RepID=UPI0030C0DF04